MSDSAGNLYNKDAVLQFLLPGDEREGISNKSDCEEILGGRVKSIRDVVEVKFELENNNGQSSEERNANFVCPVTNKQLGPSVKSVYLVPCGHAFSEGAIREMKTDKCLQCNESYEPANVIPILPVQDTEKERLKRRMWSLTERGLTHSLKKAPGSKKRKKNGANEASGVNGTKAKEDSTSSRPGPSTLVSGSGPTSRTATPVSGANSGAESRRSTPTAQSGIKNAATAMLTARVLEEENERNKKRKVMGTNEAYRNLFTSDSKNAKGKDNDFMTRGFSIPSPRAGK